jgi:hypothetical protein
MLGVLFHEYAAGPPVLPTVVHFRKGCPMNEFVNKRRVAAKAGCEFGYAMVENYRTLYAQSVDDTDPRFVGGFGV